MNCEIVFEWALKMEVTPVLFEKKSDESINSEGHAPIKTDFVDLNRFHGLGDESIFNPPTLTRSRFWSLNRWKDAPRDLGYNPVPHSSWKQLRLQKSPETQSVYHDILWELHPRTIIELGVFSGGSLVWFRDLTKIFGLDCKVVGVDNDLSRCRIPVKEFEMISIHAADCNTPESLSFLQDAQHPILFIEATRCNTFNVLKYALKNILQVGDYIIIEDIMPTWNKNSPHHLQHHLSAFNDFLAMDLLYANVPGQLQDGVFKVLKNSN